MKKHTTLAGPTGLNRIRSLVAFRHHNPVARFISTLVAFAIAMLLVVGTGAAYADDVAPAPDASTATTDTPADPATTDAPADTPTDDASPSSGDSSAPSDPTPTDSETPSDTSTGGAATDTRASSSSGPVSTTLKRLIASPAAGPALCGAQVAPVLVGTFEIDGNTCVDDVPGGKVDWNSFVDADSNSVNDILYQFDDAKDATAYKQGDSESSAPATWHTGGSSEGKDDITDAWSYTKVVSGAVWTFFGVQRVTDNGTTTYDVELNHLANSPGQQNPNRTAAVNGDGGDLLLQFEVNGNGPLTFDKAYQWTAEADFDSPSCFEADSIGFGWCPLNTVVPPDFQSSHSTDGLFAEGAINLSALAQANGQTCSGSFGYMNIRTVASESHTAALQDYVLPFPTNIPSSCGSIVIHKYADDGTTLLGGAHFTISPDPTPGSNSAGPVTLIDGGTGDSDNTANGIITINPAEADSYTVIETQAPAGYLLPGVADRTKTFPLAPGANQTVTFNFTDPYQWLDLTVDKTATPTYSASYLWSIDKQVASSVDGPWTDGAVGTDVEEIHTSTGSGTAFFQVTVTQGAKTTSNYQVAGVVRVKNPNTNRPVSVNLGDSIAGATCTFPGGTNPSVLGDNAFHSYAYTCTFAGTPSALTGDNQATVSWSKAAYPQSQGDLGAPGNYTKTPTAPYDFTTQAAETSSTNKTIHVTDTRHDFTPNPYEITWAGEGTQTVLSYSRSISVAAGTCVSQDNTAAITETAQSDTATATVCRGADLVVAKGATGSFKRTYPWSVHKSTSTPRVDVADGKATASYQVTVTAGDAVDSEWHMGGSITVQNPNDWEDISVSSLADVYAGGGTCTVTGVRDAGSNAAYGPVSFPYVLAKSTTKEFSYDCVFAGKPSTYTGLNTATASWNGATAATPSSSAQGTYTLKNVDSATALSGSNDWAKTLVDDQVTIVDDLATADPSDDKTWDLTWADVYGLSGHKTTLDYTVDLAVPAAGTCADYVNTASIQDVNGVPVVDADGNDAVDGSEDNSATVKACNAKGLGVSKTAVGDFTRTYPWTIEKFINTDQTSQTVHIDTFDHTFSYKVVVTPGALQDSLWTVTGAITVTNENSDPSIAPIGIGSLVDDPSGSGESCVFDKGLPDHALVSGETYEVGYTCTLTGKSTTNKATVGWAGGGSSDTGNVAVTWHDPKEIDKTIEVFDNKVNQNPAADLGEATWNPEGTPTVFDYTKNLSVPESTAGSCGPDMVNTAWLGGSATEQTDRKDSTTAVICVNAGTWSVSKVNLDGDGPVPTDSDITYELTAHKTGGSNPKNVVVYDDLSVIAPYVDLPTQAELDAAAPAGSTATITGNLITWTIDELGATDQTLDFTVHVNADAYGVDLPNLVTSPGSDNCPNADAATAVCKTDNDTPHYTLDKDSSAGDQVMPPYLGAEGTLITYTLTLHNDSDAPINSTTLPDAQVTDDLSDVLDNASLEGPIVASSGTAAMDVDGVTLRWTLSTIPAGGSATLTYQVRVNADQWDEALTNLAIPGDGGDCVAEGECTTTTVTPPYAQIQVLKVDDETGDPLAGAHFTLSHDGTSIGGEVVTDATGAATFPAKLQPGAFVVTETQAPGGYSLPADTTSDVTVTEADLDNGETPVQVTFRDPAQGQLTVLSKEQQELNPATQQWVASDGVVDFGDKIHYIVHVQGTGKKLFHNVTATDYVPGYNPADTTTSPAGTKAILDASSPSCTGDFTCTASVNAATGLVTWILTSPGQPVGTIKADADGSATGTFEMTVSMPDIPGTSPIKTPGTSFAAALWNQGYLDWTQFDGSPALSVARTELAAVSLTPHHLASNEVVVRASATLPPQAAPKPPKVLPNTGGPGTWPLAVGLLLLLGGGMLVASDRRRRRRS